MRPLTTQELMAAWDGACTQPTWSRPLAVLSAGDGRDAAELAELPVGQRDAMLLTLREWAFGPEVVTVADCPDCGDPVELTFGVADVRVPAAPTAEPLELTHAGYTLSVRVPTGADLETAAAEPDERAAVACLLERCVLSARRGNVAVSARKLPARVRTAIEARLAQADPQADVELAATCPACGTAWVAVFDIGGFFWAEIEAWAVRVLHEVHRLAVAYGWREPDVLALSPRRRGHYLAMVGA